VIELHGNASYASCLDCGTRHEFAAFEAPFRERGEIPTCKWCTGLVKTATISFGQPLPPEVLAAAKAETLACDLFLVLGSSLVVTPAADLPRLAKSNGARLVIVNREPTDMDRLADLVLHDEIGPVMSVAVP
jgi:NAD-dependent deacetylase